MNEKKAALRWHSPVLLLSFLLLFSVLYIGFFFPDPHFFSGASAGGHRLLLLGVRIGLPLLAIGVLLIYSLIKSERLTKTSLSMLALGTLFGVILLHSAASVVVFHRLAARNLEDYHPFLQLSPPRAPDSDGGGAVKIFALGGSTTAWKDSTGQGWPDRAQVLLNKTLEAEGKQVLVENLGKEWYTSQHTLINYAINLRSHKPQIILVMHAINDLLVNADFSYFSGGQFSDDYGHFHGPLSRMLQPPRGPFAAIADKVRLAWYYEPREIIHNEYFPGLVSFRRNLQTLIDLARVDGVKVVLITQPYFLKERMTRAEMDSLYMLKHEAIGPSKQWDLKTALSGMRQYNQAAVEVASENKLLLIDLEKTIPKTAEFFSDEVHYRDKAFPIIAETIAREMLRSGMLHSNREPLH